MVTLVAVTASGAVTLVGQAPVVPDGVVVTGRLRLPAQDTRTAFSATATVTLQWHTGTGSTWRSLRVVRTDDGSLRATVRPATVARPGQVVVLRWRYAGSNAAQAAVSNAVRVRLAS